MSLERLPIIRAVTLDDPIPGATEQIAFIQESLGRLREMRETASILRRYALHHPELREKAEADLTDMYERARFIQNQVRRVQRSLDENGHPKSCPTWTEQVNTLIKKLHRR